MINAVMYSYKGKETERVIRNLFETALDDDLHLTLIDQHPLTRQSKLEDLNNFEYAHQFWDKLDSPCKLKNKIISASHFDHAEYILVVSDDILTAPGWDRQMKQVADSQTVVSGFGSVTVSQPDKYLLEASYSHSDEFTESNYIDRNFIFATRKAFSRLEYPIHLKYRGENETLSAQAFCRGLSVVSAPSNLLTQDLAYRTIENLYVPFAIEHQYNEAIQLIKDECDSWLSYHGISLDDLVPVPYQINDVAYDPYKLKMVDMGGERFFAQTRAIY